MILIHVYLCIVLAVEPDVLIFNKTGNEIIGTISLKNIMADKNLSYKVSMACYINNIKILYYCIQLLI